MKVLIVGSGGREHVLCWKIKQSKRVKKLYCAPGNGGISQIADCVDISAENVGKLLEFAKKNKIDLTIVGPEAPLVLGIVDAFEKAGLTIFGPNQYAAQLEGSKVFAKEFLQRRNIPTASFQVFDDPEEALSYLSKALLPVVVKADGLAAGKGVFVCHKQKEAQEAVGLIMKDKIFRDAGKRIVIEDCLSGEEVSILAIADGENYLMLESSQDHKRIFDDDLGPNTGGMGAYSPAPVVNYDLLKKIETRVIEPTIRGMKREGHPFKGVLYAGLMITSDGPMVLEYNVRFGDPETQAVLPRLQNDLLDVMLAACEGELNKVKLKWDERNCVCVVLTSGGYPNKYDTGKEIIGLEKAQKLKDVLIFHAGTTKKDDKLLTCAGRVLGVVGLGDGVESAIKKAYGAVEQITFDHCFFRRDIGMKALKRIAAKDFRNVAPL